MSGPNFFSNAQNFSIGDMHVNNAARDSYHYSTTNVRNLYRHGNQVHNHFVNSNNKYNSTHNGDIYNGSPIYRGTVNNIGSVANANFGNNYGIIGQSRSFEEQRTGSPSPPPQGPQFGGQFGPRPWGGGGGMGSGGYMGSDGVPPGPGDYTNSSPDFSHFQNRGQGQFQPQGPVPGQAPYPMPHSQTAPGRPQPNEAMSSQNPPIPSAFPPPGQPTTRKPNYLAQDMSKLSSDEGQTSYTMPHSQTPPGRPQPNEAMSSQNPPIPSAYSSPGQPTARKPNHLAQHMSGFDSDEESDNSDEEYGMSHLNLREDVEMNMTPDKGTSMGQPGGQAPGSMASNPGLSPQGPQQESAPYSSNANGWQNGSPINSYSNSTATASAQTSAAGAASGIASAAAAQPSNHASAQPQPQPEPTARSSSAPSSSAALPDHLRPDSGVAPRPLSSAIGDTGSAGLNDGRRSPQALVDDSDDEDEHLYALHAPAASTMDVDGDSSDAESKKPKKKKRHFWKKFAVGKK